jgi:hypothetical protein
VKQLSGNVLEIKVCGEMFLYEMKELVEDKTGIPPDSQRYIFAGRCMEDGESKFGCKFRSLGNWELTSRKIKLSSRTTYRR